MSDGNAETAVDVPVARAMSPAGKEFGVFLPIGNGGWMISRSAPHPEATYAYNRRVALDAR